MSLSASADAAATSMCSALGITDPTGVGQWKTIFEQIATWISSNGTVTIVAETIVTVGSPATQTGPQVPIILPVT